MGSRDVCWNSSQHLYALSKIMFSSIYTSLFGEPASYRLLHVLPPPPSSRFVTQNDGSTPAPLLCVFSVYCASSPLSKKRVLVCWPHAGKLLPFAPPGHAADENRW
jgi:hypothetical protein